MIASHAGESEGVQSCNQDGGEKQKLKRPQYTKRFFFFQNDPVLAVSASQTKH